MSLESIIRPKVSELIPKTLVRELLPKIHVRSAARRTAANCFLVFYTSRIFNRLPKRGASVRYSWAFCRLQ